MTSFLTTYINHHVGQGLAHSTFRRMYEKSFSPTQDRDAFNIITGNMVKFSNKYFFWEQKVFGKKLNLAIPSRIDGVSLWSVDGFQQEIMEAVRQRVKVEETLFYTDFKSIDDEVESDFIESDPEWSESDSEYLP